MRPQKQTQWNWFSPLSFYCLTTRKLWSWTLSEFSSNLSPPKGQLNCTSSLKNNFNFLIRHHKELYSSSESIAQVKWHFPEIGVWCLFAFWFAWSCLIFWWLAMCCIWAERLSGRSATFDIFIIGLFFCIRLPGDAPNTGSTVTAAQQQLQSTHKMRSGAALTGGRCSSMSRWRYSCVS